MHHKFRTAITAKTTESLISSLQKDLVVTKDDERISRSPSVVFVFTGQGSQYQGMGHELFKTSALFRTRIEEYDRICVQQGFPSFLELIANPYGDIAMMRPVQVQLGIVSLELALANVCESWGVQPDIVIGHSLGEYPALCVAKVLSVTDMLYLVGKRAELMEQECAPLTHAMLAIQSSKELIQRLLAEGNFSCTISCNNTPLSVVISGTSEDVAILQSRLQEDNIKCTLLKVPYAFHSAQLDPILEKFCKIAESVQYGEPATAVASSLTGNIVKTKGVFSATYLMQQARNEVNFVEALRACKSQKLVDANTLWIENGPDPVCSGMVRSTLEIPPIKTLPTLKSSETNWETISKTVASAYTFGAEIMWPDFHKEYKSTLSHLELPAYAFDLKNYWVEYKRPLDPLISSKVSQLIEPVFSTTCLQRIESEIFTEQEGSVTFVSDASEPRLMAAIQGHLVDGVGLCPSSVYSDMAFTAALYVYSKMEPSKGKPALDIAHMEVTNPLVVLPDNNQQFIKVTAVRSRGSNTMDIVFRSQHAGNSHDHGRCKVNFGDGNDWKDEWGRSAHLVQSRIDQVSRSAADQISRPMIYRLFAALVAYSEPYQGLQKVCLNGDNCEAVAEVQFHPSGEDEKFTYSPYWIDSIVHLAGFVLNGNYSTPENVVYISHGWGNLRFAGPLSADKTYVSYVRMQPAGGRGLFVGDVYMFDGETIIAICSGLKFQELKKTVLHDLLSGAFLGSSEISQRRDDRGVRHAVKRTENFVQERIQDVSIPTLTQREVPGPGSHSPSFRKIMDVMASELGVSAAERVDDAEFSDLGIDSLLSISILSKLRGTTSINLPTSVFSDCSTILDFRHYIQDLHNTQGPSTPSSSDSELPISSRSSCSSISSNSSSDRADLLISVVAKEIGVDIGEIEPSNSFSELGVDSLMSITILSKLKSETGILLPTSFFNDISTVSEVYDALSKSSNVDEKQFTPLSTGSQASSTSPYKCNVVFLQGNINSRETPLFLIADGAGSAAPYINFPKFKSGLPVYGVESPFLHCPTEFTCTIEECAAMAIAAIQSVQPHGPYILGGWSLGGIVAFEVASQLITANETVKGLIMIDSPRTKPVTGLPQITVEFTEKLGMFIPIKKKGKEEEPMPLPQRQVRREFLFVPNFEPPEFFNFSSFHLFSHVEFAF
jgi:iterative type I PKS product template protein